MPDIATVTPMRTFQQQLMAAGLNFNSLRTNTLLRKDEWVALDKAILNAARHPMNGIADLRSRNLIHDVGGLGVMTVEWERAEDMSDAEVNMSGVTPTQEDTAEFQLDGVPVPIVSKNYRLNIRRLEASRRMGSNLDTWQARAAAIKVNEMMESLLFNGSAIKSDGYKLYGYTTCPWRVRTNIGTAWDASGADPLEDVIHMVSEAFKNKYNGPFVLYVNGDYWTYLLNDYSTYKGGSWLERLKAIPQISDIRHGALLGTKECVLVQMTPDVVDLVIGQDVTNVEWNSQGGLEQHMKVLAAVAPRIKRREDSSSNSVTGIVHAFESSTSTTTTAA